MISVRSLAPGSHQGASWRARVVASGLANEVFKRSPMASPMKRVQSQGWDLGMNIMPLPSAPAPGPLRMRRA